MSLIESERLHTGRIINLDRDSVRFPDGSSGSLEMIRHPGAAAVVPFLDDAGSDDPRIVLIRQFRHAADGYLWEIPAGRVDPGEAPEVCAARELAEETGLSAARLEPLVTIFTTPGFTDERIHLYSAHDLTEGEHRREADEFVEVHHLRRSEIGRMIRNGEIVDGKTLVALLYLPAGPTAVRP
jgi:ADP-ribose pyrophosphatase